MVRSPRAGGEPSTSPQPHEAATQRIEAALKQRPNDPALAYNLGTQAHRRGEYAAATQALNRALAAAGPSLQGWAAYNLGNTYYRQGRAAEQAAPSEASALYTQAQEQYQSALRRNPRDRDAQYNYELVTRRLQELKLKEPPPSQQSQPSPSQDGQAQQQPSASNDAQHQQQATQRAHSSSAQAASASTQEQPASSTEEQATSSTGHEQHTPSKETPAQESAATAGEQPAQPSPTGAHAAAASEAQHDGKAMSTQEALWILDTLKPEERGTPLEPHRDPATERSVDQDW